MKISLKRIIASLLDFSLMFALYFALVNLYSVVVVNNNARYQNNAAAIQEVLVSSHLYEEKEGKWILISDDYDQALTDFYNDFYEGDMDDYNEAKDDSNLFVKMPDGSYEVKEEANKNALETFYLRQLEIANNLMYNSSGIEPLYSYNSMIISIGSYVSLVLAPLIIYFVVPLILKRGQTLGKKIFSLEVISQNNQRITFAQTFIRAWAMVFIILLAFKFYFISLIISILVYLFNPKHYSLMDYCAVTYVNEIDKYGGNYEEKRG